MAPFINVKSMAYFINVKSMSPFINFKSISIMLDNVKYLIFNICTLFSYALFCIAYLAVLSLLILPLQLHTPNVDLNSVTITSLNTEADSLTATFDLTFIFHSPINNNRTVSYSDLEARVSWSEKDNITLASTTLSSFTQEAKSVTVIRAKLTMADGFSNNSDVAIGIGAERDSGSLKIDVSLSGLFTLRDDDWEILIFDFGRLFVKFPAGSNNGRWTTKVVPRPVLMRPFMIGFGTFGIYLPFDCTFTSNVFSISD
ncbi:hypothetical protein KIW84_062330 [Lathyrus oleraceus]|uniref:Uncharacterized protein n=1 Tax=Pisum sativum TaxID=3888 RepID=A0A9D4W5J7_PEA|nr:hypothetical protein KIW84_062330 [Pisum sativum]